MITRQGKQVLAGQGLTAQEMAKHITRMKRQGWRFTGMAGPVPCFWGVSIFDHSWKVKVKSKL